MRRRKEQPCVLSVWRCHARIFECECDTTTNRKGANGTRMNMIRNKIMASMTTTMIVFFVCERCRLRTVFLHFAHMSIFLFRLLAAIHFLVPLLVLPQPSSSSPSPSSLLLCYSPCITPRLSAWWFHTHWKHKQSVGNDGETCFPNVHLAYVWARLLLPFVWNSHEI